MEKAVFPVGNAQKLRTLRFFAFTYQPFSVFCRIAKPFAVKEKYAEHRQDTKGTYRHAYKDIYRARSVAGHTRTKEKGHDAGQRKGEKIFAYIGNIFFHIRTESVAEQYVRLTGKGKYRRGTKLTEKYALYAENRSKRKGAYRHDYRIGYGFCALLFKKSQCVYKYGCGAS